jgi:hypothetical protein
MQIAETMSDPDLFGKWFSEPSWSVWRAILKAAFALPLTAVEREHFHTVAEREPPTEQVRELWVIAGRRGGKDSVASVIAAHAASFFEHGDRLRPGERAVVMCLAVDRDQAKIVLGYTKAYFAAIPELKAMVTRDTSDGLELDNGVDIVISTNSFRSVRGRSILLVIFDEVAFWRDEASATPDKETYKAVRPGLATLPGSMLVGITSPYRRAGLAYDKWRRHYGQPGNVLVIRAPSRVLNPTLPQEIVDEALEEDPSAAAAEWLAEWRTDIESYVSPEVVDAAVVPGRHELPPVSGVSYVGFVDPSGGSADSMTLAISHREGDRSVLDAVRERRPPFSPDDVTAEFATLLKSYGVHQVTGDRYAGLWPRERFQVHGVEYIVSERPKSDLYRDTLPMLNGGKAELLDHPRLVSQLCGLERRTVRGGRDSIDHAPGLHDDVVNSCVGSLLLASAAVPVLWPREALGQAFPIPRVCDAVYAVVMAGPQGVAVVYFARSAIERGLLVIVDAEQIPLGPHLFATIVTRMKALAAEGRSGLQMLFTTLVLSDEARRRGYHAEAVDHLIKDPDALALSAATHVVGGRVKLTAEVRAKVPGILDAAGLNDAPLRLAVLLGIVLALDDGRTLPLPVPKKAAA